MRWETNADGEQQRTAYLFAHEYSPLLDGADDDECLYKHDWGEGESRSLSMMMRPAVNT